MTDITVTEKIARNIAGAYNNAKPFGMGMFHFVPGDMPIELAYELAALCETRGELYLDYFEGRCIKTRFLPDGTVTENSHRLYDRDYGPGALDEALTSARVDPRYSAALLPDKAAPAASGAAEAP